MSLALVCVIGIGTVFVGLIALIGISYLMSFLCELFSKPEAEVKSGINPSQMPRANKAANASAAIPNKQELVAAACAVIAEELGTEVSNIKVTSFKKL